MLGLALYILDVLHLSILMCLYRNTFGCVFGLHIKTLGITFIGWSHQRVCHGQPQCDISRFLDCRSLVALLPYMCIQSPTT